MDLPQTMETPEERILIANGIVRSEENKQLYCSICVSKTYSNNWQNHMEATSHVNILERFNWLFDNNKKEVQCKICKLTVTWETLQTHAISHKITPWYKPDDLDKIFFENHMLQWLNRLYCFPCNVVFLEWSAAYLHINEKNHKNQIKAVLPEDKTLSLNGSNFSYKSFVSDAVISWNSNDIACNICKCFGMGIKNFVQHVEGFFHSNCKSRLISNLNERIYQLQVDTKKRINNPEKGNSNDKPIKTTTKKQPVDGSDDSDYPTMFDDYIEQDSATEFYCSICDRLMNGPRPNIERHAASKQHEKSRHKFRENKILFLTGYDFYCEYCRCKIYSTANVHHHIEGRGHKTASSSGTNLSENKECLNQNLDSELKLISNPNEPLNPLIVNTEQSSDNSKEGKNKDKPTKAGMKKPPIDGSVYPTMLDDFIQQKNITDFYCTICNLVVNGRSCLEEHAGGKKHGKVMKKFRENKISFAGGFFNCEYCRCKIPSIDDVNRHIAERSHEISSLSGTNLSENKECPNQNLDSELKLISNQNVLLNPSIVNTAKSSDNSKEEKNKDKPTKAGMKKPPIDGSVYPTMLDDFIQQKNITDFYCTICNLVVNGRSCLEEHAGGKKHGKVMKKFRENKISFAGGFFNCEYCRCKIPSIDDVNRHIAERSHEISSLSGTNLSENKECPNQNLDSELKLISNPNVLLNPSIVNTAKSSDNSKEEKNKDKPTTVGMKKQPEAERSHKISSSSGTNLSENKECPDQNLDSEFKPMSNPNEPLNTAQSSDKFTEGKNKDNAIETKFKKQSSDGSIYPTMFDDYIRQNNSKDYHCTICYRFMSSRTNIEGHATGKEHRKVLKKFQENKISYVEGSDFYCECCRFKIPRIVNVNRHITERHHTIALSRETNLLESEELLNPNTAGPSDNPNEVKKKDKPIKTAIKKQPDGGSVYPTMFNSYIQQDSSTAYYCTICDRVLYGHLTIAGHVTGKNHVQGLEKFRENKISFLERYDYYCGYCRCKIYSTANVYRHIAESSHEISVSEATSFPQNEEISKSNEILNNLDKQEQSKNIHVPKIDGLVYGNIVISNSTNAYCKICDCSVDYSSNSNIEEHIIGNQHLRALNLFHKNRISFKKGDKYHCGYCSCSIFSNFTVHEHIGGYNHVRMLKKFTEPNETAEPTSKKLPCNYVVYLTDKNDVCCKICDCTISGDQKNINDHVAGEDHAIAFKKYGCDKISTKKGIGQYYCKLCQCVVSGIGNLCHHIKGNRHKNSLNLSNGEVKTTDKPNPFVATIAEPSKSMVLPRCNGFSNMSMKLKPRKPRNSRQKFVNMIWDAQIRKLRDPVRCSVCGVQVANVVELHSHLARHFNENFIISNIDMSNDENIDNHKGDEKKNLAKSFNSSTESISSLASDSEYFDTSDTPEIILKPINKPGRLERTPKKANMKRIVQDLDFEDDHIFSMKDKLRELELGMKLCFVTGLEKIYCLVCQKMIDNTMDNYYKHLCSLDHIVYLERMESDDALFEQYPEQLSSIDLGLEYMEEISKSFVRCHICDTEMDNEDDILENHIENIMHSQKCENMHVTAMKNFEHIKLRVQCNWYKIERYRCVPCLLSFRSEFNFMAHLKSMEHQITMKTRINNKRQLIIDFCEACALLWYGYRRTYAYHCDIETHVWLIRDGHYVPGELPKQAKELLANSEKYIDDTIKKYNEISSQEQEKEKILIRDIEKTVTLKYRLAKAYTFGSRVTGVGSPDSDIDVFLDCGNMYDGIMSSEDTILCYMNGVTECLNQDPQSWVILELLKTCRSPIIKAYHRVTGLSCDISFENGLAVENTALIKSFNDAFPLCRKMIIFLKRWMALCKLSGSECITSYALYWLVIFYLQKESIFPNVTTLITMKSESRTIAGWEVGVARNFTYNKLESIFGIKELLVRFFTFWANFDYRYDVACPMIGEIVKKRTFAEPQNLPNAMAPYVNYIKTSEFPDPLRIDSTMCIQDPFDLQHNVTKAVNKTYVNRFRTYCSKSLDVLCSL